MIRRNSQSVTGIAAFLATLALIAGGACGAPVPLSGLQLWLQGDTGITTNADGVTRWADQSGNGRDATVLAGDSEPDYVSSVSALGGRPALRFDGTDERFIIETTGVERILGSGTLEFTVFTVGLADIENNTSMVGIRDGSAPLIQLDQQGGSEPNLGKSRFILRNGSATQANALGQDHTGSYGIYSGDIERNPTSGDSTVSVYFDGPTPEGSATADFGGAPDFGDGVQMIGGLTSGSTDWFWDGDIAEVLIYDRALSLGEKNQVGFYLEQKYSLQTAYLPEPAGLIVLALTTCLLLRRRP